MKKFMILAVMMVATLTASAQQEEGTWSVTPKVGFNLANLAGDVEHNSMKFGLAAGAEAMYQFTPMIGLSAGLLYSMQGCEYEGDAKFSLDELNIPVLANFYVYDGLALKIGLQPGIIVSAKSKSDKVEVDIKSSCQTIELCVPIGVSYEFSSFVIDARYNLGLSKINKSDGSMRNSVFQISVGYKIPF